MKKIVKYIILGLVLLAAVGAGVYSMTAPVVVPLTQVNAKTAELSFTEQGLVVAESVVQVYPTAQGRLVEVSVTEGQSVLAGDVLCVVDPEPLMLQMSRIESGIRGYEAQLANLDTEQERLRNELMTNKNSLLGELAALEAQERSSDISLKAQNISVEEQLRLQEILIAQSQTDLDRAKDELGKAQILYEAGSLARAAYDEYVAAVTRCETALEANKQELVVISGGTGLSSEEYYKGAKASINAQIAGINQSLEKNYTAAMKEYYNALIQGDRASIAQLEKDISNCSVTAPVNGIVTRLNAKNTNVVSTAAPVAEITVPGGNTVEVYVSTKDVDSIDIGDTVDLILKRREGDLVFTGSVAHIDTTAVSRYSSLGVEEYRVKTQITPHIEDAGEFSFGIGYSVDVKFLIYREDNKLAVPKTAIFKADDRDMLWVVREGAATAVEIVKGLELRTETIVESGVMDGDYVVIDANNDALKNGVKVKNE